MMFASVLPRAIVNPNHTINKLSIQIVRNIQGKKNHRKPRWMPRAKSKMFLLPPKHHIPEFEENQVMTLKFRHHDQMAALTQYLWEDYLRNSDVGEAAKIEAAREEKEHRGLLKENEAVNSEIAAKRVERLKLEAQQEEERIKLELVIDREQKSKKRSEVDKIVVSEGKQLDLRIKTLDDIESAINYALDNPKDNEFAIDKEGHIYRGRYTKSILTPRDKREIIPTALSEGERILGSDKVPDREEIKQ